MFGPSYRLLKVLSLVFVALIFYSLARLEFLVWNWNLFNDKAFADILWSFVVGLRFDLAAVLSLSAPLILLAIIPWPRQWNKVWLWGSLGLFWILQTPFFILNLVDTEFINFVGRRFSYDTLFILNEAQGKFLQFVATYWPLFLVNTFLVAGFIFSAWKIFTGTLTKWSWPEGKRLKLWGSHALISFFVLALTVVGIRGGLQKKPVNFVNANIFSAPLLNNLVLNSSFTFIKSYGAKELPREKYFTDQKELLSQLNGSLKGSLLEGRRPAQPQNVVVIILESFAEEYIGPHQGQTFTPFLDSLKEKSLSFENSYANGRRSIEGIAAIMAGIPALMSEPFISSHFTSNHFLGLGALLGQQKYSTGFFHGGRNGTMYFDSFMQSAGVEKYFGSAEYSNDKDDDGVWGIWDEPFLQYMIGQIDQFPKPFMTSVFTLSSHHPFKVPEQYKSQLPKGPLEILQTIAYTDLALKKFFDEASKKPWFKDTLFIITADHTSMRYRPEYENDIGVYRVPLILYHPTYKFPEVDRSMVVQHIDILPTVLDFLGLPEKDKNYLGSSVFVPGDKVAINFIDGRYILAAKDHFLRWSPSSEQPQIFSMTDWSGTKELQPQSDATLAARSQELLKKLKANIQYFNEGMWDNKLYYPASEQELTEAQ